MSTYNLYETEIEYDDEDHVEKEDEERLTKVIEEQGLELDEFGDLVQKKTSVAKTMICSCGFYTCPMVKKFGHPMPVFKEQIEPLHPQGRRDKRAVELKKGSN